jgi:ribosomal protein S18 acetylase RimI-like enzyme
MYKTEFCDRTRWREVVSWIHRDIDAESPRTENVLDTLHLEESQGVVGAVVECSHGKDVAGCYTALLPGRVLSLGGIRLDQEDVVEPASDLLRRIMGHYAPQAVELVQAIAIEFTSLDRQVLTRAGLKYLAHLDHLVLLLDQAQRNSSAGMSQLKDVAAGLRLREFREGWDSILEEIVAASYIDTLDCPGLGDLRTGKAAVEGYLASRSQTHSWWLAEHQGTWLGCLLLWERAPAVWELAYMGLIPSARGRRFGEVLLEAAISITMQLGGKQLVLSVDRENLPATRIYDRRGFYCYNSTEVWCGAGSLVSGR